MHDVPKDITDFADYTWQQLRHYILTGNDSFPTVLALRWLADKIESDSYTDKTGG